ncbi:response regulator transcription factor [Flammeovirga sp. SJP92]|uniref:response regulator n=1 Tax=Flammeovirga sp. SJP92 TaxID=1775430 RepID=UPI000788E74A|nr:response regulator transcription factor [Flammeovirga sp. SJP92]KXX68301.1 hypothetical protein AVL50_21185 [Flammeovirga sp. SJP92]
MIKIFLVDDHEMIREGLKTYFEKSSEIECIGEAENGVDCLEKLKSSQPDIVVTDLNMPEMDGIELAKQMSSLHPDIKVLGLTMMDDHRHVKQFLAEGASGYLLKDCKQEELLMAIKTVSTGGTYFSPKVTEIIINSIQKTKPHAKRMVAEVKLSKREKEVLELILKEYSNTEIAEALFVSMKTVEAHKRNLLVKTGSKNIAGLILYVIGTNLIDF